MRAKPVAFTAFALWASLATVWLARTAEHAWAQGAQPEPHYQVLFVPSMVRSVCLGDDVVVRFSATQTNANDPLAALVPPSRRGEPAPGQETFVLEATGGTVTPSRAQLLGVSEVFSARFHAAQAGAARVTVRPARGTGEATKTFTVEQHCDYRVEAFARAVVAREMLRVEEVFVARGDLDRTRREGAQGGDARALSGDGTVWVRADLFGGAGPVRCTIDPMIGHGAFHSTGTLVDGTLEFSLRFEPVMFEHSIVFRCVGPNMQLNLPVETGRQGGDANRLGLRDLSTGAWGGSMSFAYGPSTGVLTITPR